jgi:predicted acylesterase/phospholipase RssA
MPASTITEMYRGGAHKIFSSHHGGFRRGPRYDASILKRYLTENFGDTHLADLPVDVLVPVSTLDTFQGRMFTRKDADVTLVEAALATSAAPTYFQPVTPETMERSYVEGGMWATSPSLLAILYSHHDLGKPMAGIRMLSVGTGTHVRGSTPDKVVNLRPFSKDTLRYIYELMMGSQTWFAETFSEYLLSPERLVRVDPRLPERIDLDDATRALAVLPGLAEGQYENFEEAIESLLDDTGEETDAEEPEPSLPVFLTDALREANVQGFFPTRLHYVTHRPGTPSIDAYAGLAKRSLLIVSVYLGLGLVSGDIIARFREMLLERDEPPDQICVSLLDPQLDHLTMTLAPSLGTTQSTVVARITESLDKLWQFKASLPPALQDRVEIRAHRALPSASAILIDHKLPYGRIQLETKPYGVGMQRSFALEIAYGSEFYGTLVESYERLVADGEVVT